MVSRLVAAGFNQTEMTMKKFLVATAALALMCGSAFAQNTGPAPQQDNMTKPGQMNNSTSGSMEKGSMEKGTTGMNNEEMKKEGMSKNGTSTSGMSGGQISRAIGRNAPTAVASASS